jgi:hypothetical protein
MTRARMSLLGLILTLCLAPASSGADPLTAPTAIVDSIGGIPTSTMFEIGGAGGPTIMPTQHIGPAFTLTSRTVITEIGGFVTSTLPLRVEIRPEANGLPDTGAVLATFELSQHPHLGTIAYESVQTNLTLPAGQYFAMFVPQSGDSGFALGTASFPFFYRAENVDCGVIEASRVLRGSHVAAFRILGRPAEAGLEIRLTGATGRLADGDVVIYDDNGRGHRLRAGSETAEQLASRAGRTLTVVGTTVEDPDTVPTYPILVRDFRVEPAGAFDGQDVIVTGDTERLPDGDVIVYDSFGRGHRLRGTDDIAVRIDLLSGKRVVAIGRASVTNTASRLTWPIDVTTIFESPNT